MVDGDEGFDFGEVFDVVDEISVGGDVGDVEELFDEFFDKFSDVFDAVKDIEFSYLGGTDKDGKNVKMSREVAAFVFGCEVGEVAMNWFDVWKGGSIYYSGQIDEEDRTTTEGLDLPDNYQGTLDLSGLTSAEGLTLPYNYHGILDLSGLTTTEGLVLPEGYVGPVIVSRDRGVLSEAELVLVRWLYPSVTFIRPDF